MISGAWPAGFGVSGCGCGSGCGFGVSGVLFSTTTVTSISFDALPWLSTALYLTV